MATRSDGSLCLRRKDIPRNPNSIMAAYEFDPHADGWVFNGVPYVALNSPGRPELEGRVPDGVIYRRSGTKAVGVDLFLAPESSVRMATKSDGSLCLRIKD